jgi:hypothetical protein
MTVNGFNYAPKTAKERRRLSADKRIAEAQLRSPQEQLARLDAGGHAAVKERKRLLAKIAKI